ncbi:MAG: hypothetical protein WB424_02895 [Terracidiphilus sp.]
MTGANTDKITTPLWEQACCLILRISCILFQDIMGQRTFSYNEDAVSHWRNLRLIAAKYLENRTTFLRPEDRERMIAALKFTHEHYHILTSGFKLLQIQNVEDCTCPLSSDLRALALILAEDAEQREVAFASNSL